MTAVAPAPPPPSTPLGQRVFDLCLWGGLAILLVISFGPAELVKFPLLFKNSENMRQFGQEFLRAHSSDRGHAFHAMVGAYST